jgi:hypothetical protein
MGRKGKNWKEWNDLGLLGEVLARGKRMEELGVGRKGWEINTHIVKYLLKKM